MIFRPGNDLAREQLDENSFQYFPANQGIPLGYFPYKVLFETNLGTENQPVFNLLRC